MNELKEDAPPLTREQDAELGQSLYISMNNKVDRIARHYGIDEQLAADYLLASALLTAASRSDLPLAAMPAIVASMVSLLQEEAPDTHRRH